VSTERSTYFALFSAFIAAVGSFLFGYHLAIVSGALIFLTEEFTLTIHQEGLIVSILLIGAIIGSLIAGPLSDRFSRKSALFISSLFFLGGTMLMATAHTIDSIVWGRLIAGIGVGIVSVASPIYLAEIAPPRYRGAFVTLNQLSICLGILGAFLVDYAYSNSSDWQMMFAVGYIPALILFIGTTFIPNTPAWLLSKGKKEKAIRSYRRLRADTHWQEDSELVNKSDLPIEKSSWKVLLDKRMRFVLTLGILISAFQQITGINAVIYFSPKIFEMAHFGSASSAIFASVDIGIVNVIAALISLFLMDRWGRRPLLILGITGMVISLLILATAFLFQTELIDMIAVISLMAYVGFFSLGLGAVTWIILSEIFPLNVRGKAMTVAIFVNWVANYLVSLTFLDIVAWINVTGAFYLFAAISIAALYFVWRYLPETKGKTLAELENKLIR
jgi:SP family galactose:H+ symporter-like MFS transporter